MSRPQADETLTLEEWAALDEDASGEWVDGHLEAEEMPTFVHEMLVAHLIARFQEWAPDALVVGSESKLAVSPRRGRKPDLAVWFGDSRWPDGRASVTPIPPDVAVEIVTATPRDARRDRVAKHDEYAAFGVRYYWLVDPELRTVEVFALREPGVYARVLGASDGAALAVPGIGGATFDLDAAWRAVDEVLRRTAEDPPPDE